MMTPDNSRMAFTWWEVKGDGVGLLYHRRCAAYHHESWRHDLPGMIKRNAGYIWVGALYCSARLS